MSDLFNHALGLTQNQLTAVEKSDPDALHFNITFNDPSGKFSAYYSAIKSHILAAGSSWDKYITGNADLEIVVNFSNPNPTATGRSLTSSFVYKKGTLSVYEPGAVSEIRTGVDPNGATPDIEFNFNPDYLVNELWFDPKPVARTTAVPINKTDAVSLLLHEFGHVFGFNAWKDNFDGTLSGNYQSTFDEKIIFDGSNFFFVGKQATSVYGSPVPLTFGNITHVGNDGSRPGVNLVRDLMNGVKFYRGFRYSISSLNVAILKDVGVPIVDVPTLSLSSVTTTLPTNVENLTLTGTSQINGTGNAGNNILKGNSANNKLMGNAGNDTLDGGAGKDTLNGGSGDDILIGGADNDSYYVDSSNDQIIELLNEGTDTVRTTVNWKLSDNLENLVLTGTSGINGTGNALKNTITVNKADNQLLGGDNDDKLIGDAGNDTLNGGDGNDSLVGGNGNDSLVGGNGNDTLVGGAGSDRLTGGTDSDKFVFSSLGEGIDTITDFSSTEDFLVVQTLLTHLNYTGINPIADGYIRGIQSGSSTLIQIDIDGLNGNSIFSTLVTVSNFIASNFSLNNLIF
ncbi:calcium-binding protein [Nostoc sp. FACHB-87]|uniref:calcium-binding protein n=1 Tax=Nostocaceae TaxID=1162 RepID=UPI001687532F|nr:MULTISPECIES: calcium-binding protein [Nostocaceae]MBD2455573.1 calcium-binding protein [Nostoc sp. FACHB-87]MBD2477429.1 calcium-binding protein [Anabaena sp. FACHB-83]